MKEKINDILLKIQNSQIDIGDAANELLALNSLCYSEREIDFAYLVGVFNASGIDGLQKEIERLKKLNKNPHNIIIGIRK